MLLKDTNTGSRKFSGQAISGRQSRDLSVSEALSATTAAKKQYISGGSSSASNVQDASIQTTTSASAFSLFDVFISYSLTYGLSAPTFTSSNSAVATVDNNGTVTAVGNGSCTIRVDVTGLNSLIIPLTISSSGGQTTVAFNSYLSGSLAAELMTTVAGLINSKTPSTSTYNIFSTYTPPSTFVRNASLFASGVDLTCIPAYGSVHNVFMGCLVTPRHVLGCQHEQLYVGDVLYFVDNSNVVSSRTIVAKGNIVDFNQDTVVYRLDSDVPAGITPALVLPSTYRSQLPGGTYGYPVLNTNQFKTLQISAFSGTFTNGIYGTEANIVAPINNAAQEAWYSNIISGDSGSPIIMPIGGQTVLLSTWHFPTSGPSIADYISQINAKISSLGSGGGYTLTAVDLSSYNSY